MLNLNPATLITRIIVLLTAFRSMNLLTLGQPITLATVPHGSMAG